MALKHLTDEQIRTWSREEKDRWWLENVFRGDMPQLTWRSGITGFILGAILSATNLYVGAKTGWTLGVGLTSVILAFIAFRAMARIGLAKDFTILENNAMQSIATAAGYMTGPLIASLSAYMLVKNETLPWQQMMAWVTICSLIGVLVAFPMKRRFINDEQQPFPEGRACGVVLDALYTSEAAVGVFKARALLIAALFAGFLKFIMGEGYQHFLQVSLLSKKFGLFSMEEAVYFKEHTLDYYYERADESGWWIPSIAGVDMRQLALTFALDLSMFGAGGLMGPRIASSLLLGCIINWMILAPWMINIGEIVAKTEGIYGRALILNGWSLWWGITAMVVASLVSLFAKPGMIISAFTGLFGRKEEGKDVLKHIELPLRLSFVGVPLLTFVAAWMCWAWFGMVWWHGLLAVPLICVLTLIAANATALTSTTPTGALSKITQFTFGALDRTNPATNLMTAGMTAEIASNASNLLMDIKPGYMLGAKPRQQAVGHVIGIVSGALASIPLFFLLYLYTWEPAVQTMEQHLITEEHPFPGAVIWKGVNDLIASGGANLQRSAIVAMAVAAVAAVFLEIGRIVTKGKLPLSALAIGLGVVIPPESTFMMWAGAMFFFVMGKIYSRKGTTGNLLWVETHEPICAGLIAGTALIGIGDVLLTTFGEKLLGL